jgi:hypothetical protein
MEIVGHADNARPRVPDESTFDHLIVIASEAKQSSDALQEA